MSAELNPKGCVAYAIATSLEARCGVCAYYDAECHRCTIVAGEIESDCVCALFVTRRAMRAMGGTGMPASVSTIPVLDIPTLGRMDLMPGYSDVMRSFVRRSTDGHLEIDAAEVPGGQWLAAIRKAVGVAATTEIRVGNDGVPVLDLIVREGQAAELVPHSPYLMEFAVVKADDEQRYTLGPLYMPDTLDAHGEFVAAETLQNAAWDYVRSAVKQGSNTIFDQHTSQPAGEWVDLVTWPYEQTVDVVVPGEGIVQRTFPPGTVYQGVVWSPRVWEQVKNGEKRGLSMGGTAVREPVAAT